MSDDDFFEDEDYIDDFAEEEEPEEELTLEDTKNLSNDFRSLFSDFVDLAKSVNSEFSSPEEVGELEAEEVMERIKEQRQAHPKIQLLGVEFEWEGSDPSHSSIPLHTLSTGWGPEPRSPIVYSILQTKKAIEEGKLKLKARFHSNLGKGSIQVRTRASEMTLLDVLTNEIQDQQPGFDALGNVAPTTVYISETGYSVFRGKYTYVSLPLENVKFPELGVGVYDINLVWEFRIKDQAASEAAGKTVWEKKWQTIRVGSSGLPIGLIRPFQVTKHRLYVTLDRPSAPWTTAQIPDVSKGIPVSLPLWAHALDIACNWAAGAQTKGEVAELITDALYDCGRLVYHSSPYYSKLGRKSDAYAGLQLSERSNAYIVYFHFNKLIERLKGGNGLGEKVNCFDCALTVATLANMLGCNLRVGKLQNMPDIDSTDANHYTDNRFEIFPLQAIGEEEMETQLAGVSEEEKLYFAYHAVAWATPNHEPGTPEDFLDPRCTIYDASVRIIDEGVAYTTAGMMRGSAETSESYISWLSPDTPEGLPRCKPQPVTVVEIQLQNG